VSRIADQIRQAPDLHTEAYEVVEWGVKLELRSMSARQRAAFASEMQVGDDGTPGLTSGASSTCGAMSSRGRASTPTPGRPCSPTTTSSG